MQGLLGEGVFEGVGGVGVTITKQQAVRYGTVDTAGAIC